MLKVKKIKLSGFRGILQPQELDLVGNGGGAPRSLVLYGQNSSGKTSFVDGLEWFLSRDNEIEWLRREDAKERAYPHQDAKDGESFVEIEFDDTEKKTRTLRKTFNHKKVTQPVMSPEQDFEKVYDSFIIRPYLRYLEVVDFVLNRTGLEKYEKLASWMGFGDELVFQEKLALDIVPGLKEYEKNLLSNIESCDGKLNQLISGSVATDVTVLKYWNDVLKIYNLPQATDIEELWKRFPEINKLRIPSTVASKVDKLVEVEVGLSISVFSLTLGPDLKVINEKIQKLRAEKSLIEKIDVIALYTQALDLINKTDGAKTNCPVCGTEWDRKKLLAHIEEEFTSLKKIKQEKDRILEEIRNIKVVLKSEKESVSGIVQNYENAKKIIADLAYTEIIRYQATLESLESFLNGDIFTEAVIDIDTKQSIRLNEEKDDVLKKIASEKSKLQPSKAELKLVEDIDRLTRTKESWDIKIIAENEYKFSQTEIKRFTSISDELVKRIQDDIKSRFAGISESIGKYFGILRQDKDVKNIQIVLNEAKGRAIGRSAEISLNYYDISVKPAYKVLSESLLNSLGLAVYFTCAKQFNNRCGFIVLDDIMNSLDMGHRDTVLDLIEQEMKDYQIILFTHDLFWFQKIQRRFPTWISKKILGWDYKIGPKIDTAKTNREEVEELLKDPTKTEDAGIKFGRHVEGILNELCENLWAETRHRYLKNEPPSMEELFEALCRRLKSKIGEGPLLNKALEAKKYEPLIRNFTGHPRENYPTSISPEEVRRAMEKWFDLEGDLWCASCNHYVSYSRDKDSIECRCGLVKLVKVTVVISPDLREPKKDR